MKIGMTIRMTMAMRARGELAGAGGAVIFWR
jgi:hypothetical protein